MKDEPTPWLSNLVVVPKGDGVRVCSDMCGGNKAMQRTNYSIPTVDDLLVKLKGSTVFTKLDLNNAFKRLELDESCRYITRFPTDTKLKRYTRYTRLMFGANSASRAGDTGGGEGGQRGHPPTFLQSKTFKTNFYKQNILLVNCTMGTH